MRPNSAASETPLRYVHKALPHDSAAKHVQGAAEYIDDIPEPAGTLHVAVGGSPVARGTIRGLALTEVQNEPGVVAVVTAADIPGKNDVSPSFADEPVLAEDSVIFHGQPVFAVVATSRDAARRAALRARFDIEAERPNITVEQGKASGERVLPDYAFVNGDAAKTIATSPFRSSGTLSIGGQEHFYLEGQVALAVPGEDGTILVYSSTQHPSEVQHIVARVLALPDSFVTCSVRRMGGGFGGKETQATQWAVIAALAARVTGRPCKLRLDRDADMVMTGKRHDFAVSYAVGYDADGRMRALDIELDARCGCSADLSLGVVDRAMFHADNAYFLPEFRIHSRRIKTNTVSNTAFRGFGGPQGMMAIERVIDAIAWRRGLDPLDVRKANLYAAARNVTPYGQTVEDHDVAPRLIEQLERSSSYRARRQAIAAFNARSPVLKRGIALTPVKFGISFTLTHLNQAGALVHVYQDGSVHLNHGGTEMGQGLFQKMAQVAAEEFGIGLERVRITATSTDKVPNTSPTAASAGTDLNAMAVQNAVREIKARLARFAAEAWSVEEDRISFRDDRVFIGNESIAFGELTKKAYAARVHLSAAGFYKTPKLHWDREKAKGRPFFYFAYGAACSEVVIDILTGEMSLRRVDILHDVGRSINPAIDIGQIEGGFVQGMGWLTTEELVYDEQGRLLTHAPSTYKIPVAADVPADFRVALFEGSNREETIYRSKAVGEPPLMLAISVFAALADAIHSLHPGKPVALDAPATPEAILKAIGPVDAVAALAPLAAKVHAQSLDKNEMAKIWTRIRQTIERHGSAALLSVIDAAGSVPRERGARIVLQPDGGFYGTIGGGRLEYEAMARARATLAAGRGRAEFRDWPLGPNLGQCCGGIVRTLTETFDAADLAAIRSFAAMEKAGTFTTASRLDAEGRIARVPVPDEAAGAGRLGFSRASFHERFGEAATPVLLFGAGHVGRAVVLALAPLPFSVRWIDSRQDQFPPHVPQNAVPVCTGDVTHELAQAPCDAMVVVMTHSHPLDFDITAAALQRDAFDCVGLIGSETKRARFASWARQLGVAQSRIDRLVCPIGIPQIRGKEPAVIAAGIAAQLLIVREQVSVPLVSPATQPA